MRLVVLTGLLLFTEATPGLKRDVALGYIYKPPATSYGVPSGSVSTAAPQSLNFPSQSQQFYQDLSQPVSYATSTLSPLSLSSTPASNFQLPLHEFSSFTNGIKSVANIPLDTSSLSGSLLGSPILQNAENLNLATPGVAYISNTGDYNFPNIGTLNADTPSFNVDNTPSPEYIGNKINTDNSENIGEPQVEVSKHLYFYSSPEDIQQPRQRINLPTTHTKKNVKILFIKAPAVISSPPITIPTQQQNEEKTLVYVLVKKPEEPAPIEINTPPPTQPSKPEVYFIKYKTQKEADEAVANIQNQHSQDKGNALNKLSQNIPKQGTSATNNDIPGSTFQGFSSQSLNFPSQQSLVPNGENQLTFQALSNVNPNSAAFSLQNLNLLGRTSLDNNRHNSDSLISPSDKNAEALSESFGGVTNLESPSESVDALHVSTVKSQPSVLGAHNSLPQPVYGVPNKRGTTLDKRT